MDPHVKTFLTLVRVECKANNVELLLKPTKKLKIENNIVVGGYFEDYGRSKGVLACAMKHEYALPLLVHEFSHMQQWIENTRLWNNGKYILDIDRWLAGEEVRDIEEKINKVRLMELDCERRTIKYIIKYNLPINIKTYAQKANAYLFFYNWMKETRVWSKENNSPYADKNIELWGSCPGELRPNSYYRKIPKNIYKKFVKLGI